MKAYYNDIDRFCCDWLQNLMDGGHITPGKIDDRSIADISPADLDGYERVHFFAGIGGWELALEYAGWRGPVWTGSCPCQPLSGAGLRQGHTDERHLWPAFYELIAECKPPVVFGEQVASPLGREWFAGVCLDMEALGYACGAADLCAAGIGAPHIRQRLWWVAESESEQSHGDRDERRGRREFADGGGLGNTDYARPQRRNIGRNGADKRAPGQAGMGFWSATEWLQCGDGKARRVEPGIFPLADGFPNRVGILRGSGNAIVPEVAAEFIGAYMEAVA